MTVINLNNFPNSQKILKTKTPFILIDIGARRGFHPIFNNIDNINKIGFEPDKEEFDNLISKKKKNETFYQEALADRNKNIFFYYTKNIGSSGLLIPNFKYYSRFIDEGQLKIKKKIEIKVTTLDNYKKKKLINDLDFLKIDTEGYDLNILKGGRQLVNNYCLGVQSEVYFNPVREKLPYFGEIHKLMESYGLSLYRLETSQNIRKQYSK